MKYLNFLWLLLGCTYMSNSQTLTIRDQQSNQALEGVVLISEKPQATAVTNVQGQVDLSAFLEAERIQIRSFGHKTLILSYDQIQASNFEVRMETSILNLDEVVVSATRWQQSSSNVPSKIISISPKEVALQNPQTAADLLGVSGKVFIQKSQQGGGSPMIRGFSTNRLIYTIDGVRMNNAIFRSGNLQNVISLDPFAVENTEVLFGPGSVIYGSDAIGGVMSFKTLTPHLSLNDKPLISGKALTRYSSANKEKTGHFDVNFGWKKWSVLSSFSVWDFDHLRQGSHGPDEYVKNIYPERQNGIDVIITQDDPLLQIPSAYTQFNTMQKLRFKPNEKWDFQYGFHYSETSPYGRYDRHNRFQNGTIRYAEWTYGPQIWMMNNVNISHTKKNTFYDQMVLRLALQSFEESRINRTLYHVERTTQTENVKAYSANLDFTKNTGVKNTLYYGVEFVINDVNSKGKVTDISTGIDQNGPSRYPNSIWSSIAAYLNEEWRFSDKMTFQAGIRYNQFMLNADFGNNQKFFPLPFSTTEINKGALTGSIGAVYRPTQTWSVKSNFGTAFRSPNVDDIGKVFDSEPGAVVVPNPKLEAEYAYNLDLGVAKVIGNFLKLDATVYYTLLENAMVRRDFRLNGQDSIIYDDQMSKVQAIQNAAVAKVYGIQGGLELKLPLGFSVLSDINYQIGEEELDNGTISTSRHAAPLFGVSRLRYVYKGLSLEFNTAYQGERRYEDLAIEEQSKDEIYAKDINGNNYSPSWYTLNFKALYHLSATFTLSAGIENISDQRYRPFSSGLSGAGRNFILSLRANF